MINVGIIGSGFIVPEFIKATTVVGGYHYKAIASPIEEQLKSLCEQYPIDYYSLDNEKVYNDPEVDVIYVAVPNKLHYPIAKRALECGKHVIVEKPFCPSFAQAKELIDLAQSKNLIIFDAVTLVHMPNYQNIKTLIEKLGEIKMIDLNFSQYSSRYDKLKQGIVLPAFDVKQAGGALMDLGIYNINFIVGLFGEPNDVHYFPNKTMGIDTSGVLVLDYGQFKATAVIAKDCRAPLNCLIQGDLGYVKSDYASSVLEVVKHVDNAGNTTEYALNENPGIWHFHEYRDFKDMFEMKDFKTAHYYNERTLQTMRVLEKALESGDIHFE